MKNIIELKKGIMKYFDYMYDDTSEEEIAEYSYDSFLDFSSFLDEIKIAEYLNGVNINDFSDDEISLAYDHAIEELLNSN